MRALKRHSLVTGRKRNVLRRNGRKKRRMLLLQYLYLLQKLSKRKSQITMLRRLHQGLSYILDLEIRETMCSWTLKGTLLREAKSRQRRDLIKKTRKRTTDQSK